MIAGQKMSGSRAAAAGKPPRGLHSAAVSDHPPTIHDIERRLGAEFIPYGPASADNGALPLEIVATFGVYEAEYAAIRRHVGILHLPQRGVLQLTGADRQDFLHRMLTQDVHGMRGGDSRRAFQLNDKGRIVADAIVHHGDLDTWLETDRVDLPQLRPQLEKRLFTEDVTIADISDQRVVLALHGPGAAPLIEAVRQDAPGSSATPAAEIALRTHHVLHLGGTPVTVCRWDDAGSTAFRLYVPADAAATLYQRLLDAAGYDPDAPVDAATAAKRRATLRGRPIGWSAYNTARIEAGSPLFHIDFGTDSLPGETALLDEAVSFTKGCYIGQEIVARMKNLGHPKRVIAGLKLPGDAMPIAGAQVLDAKDRVTVIGGVTSSTLSPMLGNTAIAFAVLKWGRHEVGQTVAVPAEGRLVEATVHPLRFIDA